MKKILLIAVALCGVLSIKAQIVGSTSKQIKTTYTTETKTIVVDDNKDYNRIFLGFASTKETDKYDGSEKMRGLNLGWTHGFNVTKRKLPLYVEAGLEGNVMGNDDVLVNFEIPVSLTYRYNIGKSKVKVAPYFGLNLKVNAYSDYYEDEVNRVQVGMQLGVNFDIKHFYLGLGWDKDFSPLYSYEDYDYKVKTRGARVRIGVTW